MAEKPSFIKVLFSKYREIIMYCIFGAVTTFVSWLVYSLCVLVLPFDGDNRWKIFGWVFDFNTKILLSNIISWILAVAVAFVTNKLWVFDSKSWQGKLVFAEAVSFVGGRVATGVLEIFAVPALVSIGLNQTLFGVAGLPAKILVSVVIVILNYILSKYLAFNSAKKKN